ncbi:MAG TPA: hypothetical protein VES88_01615 [Gemmatimonadaceae bacterium]|nr:hypothetical protein [Gemmatimonadaceae bacterium]
MKELSLRPARLAPAFLLLACINCGGETTKAAVATTVAANSSTSLTGVAGGVVTPPPSVIVKDQNGSPMGGATVNFAVISGGGSVSGATVTTDSSGVATVGSWTLGPVTGANVLEATSGSLNAVAFTATSTPGAAASLARNTGDSQTAPVGSAVPIPPSVLVKDANGNPTSDVAVTFAVADGGGSITGATAVTNAAGVATVGSWTLGPATGANVLNATSGTLNAVAFTATATAGAAASITRNAGDDQTAAAGSAVPIPPSVLVKDANGNPKSGVSVTFAVVSGGGSITGAAAVTNAAGVAAVGSWTLGNVGANSLSAAVTGLPPVTFTARAISNQCGVRTTHTFGTSTSGTLSPNDCQFPDGSFVDFYTTSVPEAGAYFFRQSAAFDTYLLLAMPDGTTIGENDDEAETGTNSGIKALLPAGNYLLGAGTFDPGVTGDYTISSTTAPTDVANCELAFVVKNITTTQNIATTDCNLADAGATPIYSDRYFIFLTAGTSITINMTSTTIDPLLQLVQLDGVVVAQNDNIDATTKDSRITFTVTQTNYYAIFARSVPTTAVGAYTLTIQ